MLQKHIGIFGGTFSPFHNGHLKLINHILDNHLCDELLIVPCKAPLLKDAATASKEDRLNMLQLIIKPANAKINTLELERSTPSYTVLSLEALRALYPDNPFSLFIGSDPYLKINHWHDWQKIATLSHLVIWNRPGYERNEAHDKAVSSVFTKTKDLKDLETQPSGYLYFEDFEALDISSTDIREKIQNHEDVSELVSKSVLDYIKAHKLYQND